jgi:hypothetical protein
LKRILSALLLGMVCASLAGCGSQNRAAMAHQTVQHYWDAVSQAKVKQAYNMLTSGTRASNPYPTYAQDMLAFLGKVNNLKAQAGTARVQGDRAVVPVTLHSIATNVPLRACNHLFWQNGHWYISDENGGLSHACSGV